MQSLWRAMALAWLGGLASPALTQDPAAAEQITEERPMDAALPSGPVAETAPYVASNDMTAPSRE